MKNKLKLFKLALKELGYFREKEPFEEIKEHYPYNIQLHNLLIDIKNLKKKGCFDFEMTVKDDCKFQPLFHVTFINPNSKPSFIKSNITWQYHNLNYKTTKRQCK